jgi:hypothetical protein
MELPEVLRPPYRTTRLCATAQEENPMEQKDYWTDTLRRKEKADEDRYFTEQDRKLIEKLHRQRQPAQEADTALPESATTEPAGT